MPQGDYQWFLNCSEHPIMWVQGNMQQFICFEYSPAELKASVGSTMETVKAHSVHGELADGKFWPRDKERRPWFLQAWHSACYNRLATLSTLG